MLRTFKIAFILGSLVFLLNCSAGNKIKIEGEEKRVIEAADKYLQEEPITITDSSCERSAGGRNDFYSEGDYWWPDPQNPDGPYIRRDGLTNPNNFTAHRKAMRRLSLIVPALVAAYKITGDSKYADHAIKHLSAWFITGNTRMNPNLLYAQAIKGRVTGRGIGIIDTIHLVEVAKAIMALYELKGMNENIFRELQAWFSEYQTWLTTHEYGKAERDNGNNHSTCWAMQVAMFAKLTGNDETIRFVQDFYKEILLPTQMADDGSFPKELARTKPYGYSIFNLDAMAMVCEIAGTDENNLWHYVTPGGRGMQKGMEFLYPYLKNKSDWKYKQDVMYWEDWPVRQPSLLFASIHFNENKYFELWNQLNPDPSKDEVLRNYPIRQPLLWIN